jgi:hypothetical protein
MRLPVPNFLPVVVPKGAVAVAPAIVMARAVEITAVAVVPVMAAAKAAEITAVAVVPVMAAARAVGITAAAKVLETKEVPRVAIIRSMLQLAVPKPAVRLSMVHTPSPSEAFPRTKKP